MKMDEGTDSAALARQAELAYRQNRRPKLAPLTAWLGVVCLFATCGANAQQPDYSQPAGNDVPRELFWGDTHVHTNYSSDSYGMGNIALTQSDAYRFAMGETLTAHNGMQVKLRRPLDFLAVSDHAEYLGVISRIAEGEPDLLATGTGQRWRGYMDSGNHRAIFHEFLGVLRGDVPLEVPEAINASIWQSVGETADQYYQPGKFTTFIAYEWTSIPMTDGGPSNLHRNVLFRDGSELTNLHVPFSAMESNDPEDLWAALASYEEATGGSVLAIPHNGNLSQGLMFDSETFSGAPLTEAYARTRMRWEPIYEVTQIKGDGEAYPILSPNDEFADFETWHSWRGKSLVGVMAPGWVERKEAEYARSALRNGLSFEEQLGVNPFKFGMIGSTDSHTGLSTTQEDNYFGKFPDSEPSPERTNNAVFGDLWESTAISASGLAAVWARENTREELFAAFRRKEVYATTGSRIMVRFFGGWDCPADADLRPDYVDIGYECGVPMGGDLAHGPDGKAPRFIIVAGKDPDGANLDRIQIIKGWLNSDGTTDERIYDVALSDCRYVDPETGHAQPVGSTADVETATFKNSIGAPVLSATWTDPDFDADQRAFYYVRVIEIPTPRWTAYDASYFDLVLDEDTEMTVQDRAYTSPIWYTP